LSTNSKDWPAPHKNYKPKPIEAEQLMLTTLGGWLKARGNFGLSSPNPQVVAWDHFASMGRDYFVRVVKRGRLYPWGHMALLIKITERKFKQVPHPMGDPYPPQTVAYLWQRFFIRVVEPVRTYPNRPSALDQEWRKFPFISLHFRTLVTPNLDIPSGAMDVDTDPSIEAIPIQTSPTSRFRFKVEAVDRNGKTSEFHVTASWVIDDNLAAIPAWLTDAHNIYNGYGETDRTSNFAGQRVSYARSVKPDDTSYETREVVFDGTLSGGQDPGVAFPNTGVPFLPGLTEARVNIEAIRTMLNTTNATKLEFSKPFLKHEFGAGNTGELVFLVKGAKVPIDFSKKSDSSGGLANPNVDVSGVGRKNQIVGGDDPEADVAAQAKFKPEQFLGNALLFGAVPLTALIPESALENAPKFITQTLDAVSGLLDDVQTVLAFFDSLSAIPAAFNDLYNALSAVLTQVQALIPAAAADPEGFDLSDAETALMNLDALIGTAIGAVDSLPGEVIKAKKEDIKRRLKALQNLIGDAKLALKAFATGLELAKNLTVKFDWETPLEEDSLGFFQKMGSNTKLVLAVEIRGKQVGMNPAGISAVAGIQDFKINVFGKSAKLMTLPFEHIMLKFDSNKKTEIDIVFAGDIGFDGILAFVQTLAKLIPGGGFSDPPAVEVTLEGITASFSIPIPSIAVGVLSIQNMRLGAGCHIPFIGDPLTINFFFCTREEPFVLTVMMIGGGGFVNLELTPKGMKLLEASFEARAQLALDFGIASGSISLAVGIYFRLEVKYAPDEQQTGELTGYVRFNGQLSVLGGLISASITLLLELTYQFETQKVWGRATLTIEVSICFISFSVSASVERKLSGSNNDPSFLTQFEPVGADDPWQEYLEAFHLAA
jgi:hypothetical protein